MKTLSYAIAALLLVATTAEALEVLINYPRISGYPVDRCVKEALAGINRCSVTQTRNVARAYCKKSGFLAASAEDLETHFVPGQTHMIYDLRTDRFEAGLGSDSLTRVRCIREDATVTLAAPENGTSFSSVPPPTSRVGNVSSRFGQFATTLQWRTSRAKSTQFLQGCVQRSHEFNNRQYNCNGMVASWTGTTGMVQYPLPYTSVRNEAGRTLFWSVRVCEVAPANIATSTVNINGRRHYCTDWETPRTLTVAARNL